MTTKRTLEEWRTPEGVADLERYTWWAIVRDRPSLLNEPGYQDQVLSDFRHGIALGLARYTPDCGRTVPSFCWMTAWQRVKRGRTLRDRWRRLRRADGGVRFLDVFTDVEFYGDGTGRRPLDDQLGSDEDRPDRRMEQDTSREAARFVVARLLPAVDPRSRLIVRLRFGLDGGPPMTLREAAGAVGLTAERVRQIEATAIYRMRVRLQQMNHPTLPAG